MVTLRPETALLLLVVIQVLGVASAALARLAEGSRRQQVCQKFFFLCLTLVGVGTLNAMQLGPGPCLTCGATLSIMVLAATWAPGAKRYGY